MTGVNKVRFNLAITESVIGRDKTVFFGVAPCSMRCWMFLI
jgi:hypothetical protein